MSPIYQAYLDYLASFADNHTMAVEAEVNILPLFTDLDHLIKHYQRSISNFSNVQKELICFIDRLEFDERDFDFYQELFKKLQKVDMYLQELKAKRVSDSISNEVESFISNIYSSASLYKLKIIEEQVLSFHNMVAEVTRNEIYKKDQKASQTRTTITVVAVLIVIIFFIIKCHP